MSILRLKTSVFVLALLPLADACASPGQASTSACTSELPRDGRSLNDVLDSTTLLADLQEVWRPQAGLTLARIHYDSVGGLDTVTVVSQFLADDVQNLVTPAVLNRAPPTSSPAETVHLFIGNDSGLSPRRVREFRICAPELLNREALARRLISEGSILSLANRTIVRLYTLVQTDGHVSDVRIDQSSSNLGVDAAAVRVMETALFRPGMIEGIATPMWANFPVTFDVPRRVNQ